MGRCGTCRSTALQVSVGDKLRPLIAQCRVRYADAFTLRFVRSRTRQPAIQPWSSAGLSARRRLGGRGRFRETFRRRARTVAIHSLPAPSCIYSTQLQRLVVFDDIPTTDRNPYGLAPMSLDPASPAHR